MEWSYGRAGIRHFEHAIGHGLVDDKSTVASLAMTSHRPERLESSSLLDVVLDSDALKMVEVVDELAAGTLGIVP